MVYNGFNFWIMVTKNMLSLNYYNHQAINNMSSNSREKFYFPIERFVPSLCGTTCTTRILFFYNFKYTKFFQSWYQKIAWFVSIFQFFLGDAPWTALKEGGNPFRTTHPLRRFAAQVNLPFTFTYTIEENTRQWLHVSFKFNISLRSGYRAQCRPFV